ncbi:uncharacterized protein LOC144592841 [Rhinoraja longicauda]
MHLELAGSGWDHLGSGSQSPRPGLTTCGAGCLRRLRERLRLVSGGFGAGRLDVRSPQAPGWGPTSGAPAASSPTPNRGAWVGPPWTFHCPAQPEISRGIFSARRGLQCREPRLPRRGNSNSLTAGEDGREEKKTFWPSITVR